LIWLSNDCSGMNPGRVQIDAGFGRGQAYDVSERRAALHISDDVATQIVKRFEANVIGLVEAMVAKVSKLRRSCTRQPTIERSLCGEAEESRAHGESPRRGGGTVISALAQTA
jgi:hypothetical protein